MNYRGSKLQSIIFSEPLKLKNSLEQAYLKRYEKKLQARNRVQESNTQIWLLKRYSTTANPKYLQFEQDLEQDLQIKAIFDTFDENRSGQLDIHELHKMLLHFNYQVDFEKLMDFFSVADDSQNGSLSYLEFQYCVLSEEADEKYKALMNPLLEQKDDQIYIPLDFKSLVNHLSFLILRERLQKQKSNEEKVGEQFDRLKSLLMIQKDSGLSQLDKQTENVIFQKTYAKKVEQINQKYSKKISSLQLMKQIPGPSNFATTNFSNMENSDSDNQEDISLEAFESMNSFSKPKKMINQFSQIKLQPTLKQELNFLVMKSKINSSLGVDEIRNLHQKSRSNLQSEYSNSGWDYQNSKRNILSCLDRKKTSEGQTQHSSSTDEIQIGQSKINHMFPTHLLNPYLQQREKDKQSFIQIHDKIKTDGIEQMKHNILNIFIQKTPKIEAQTTFTNNFDLSYGKLRLQTETAQSNLQNSQLLDEYIIDIQNQFAQNRSNYFGQINQDMANQTLIQNNTTQNFFNSKSVQN